MLFCKDRINSDCFLIFLVKKHNHALWQSIFLLWLFCQPQVMSVCQFLPSVNTPSYCFLLIIFASFRARYFIIKKKVRENRNIFGLLCLRLIFLFFSIWYLCNKITCIHFQTVNGLFTTRNSATFHSKVGHFLCVSYRVIFRKSA